LIIWKADQPRAVEQPRPARREQRQKVGVNRAPVALARLVGNVVAAELAAHPAGRVAVADDARDAIGLERLGDLRRRHGRIERRARLMQAVEHDRAAIPPMRHRAREAVAEASARVAEGLIRNTGHGRPDHDAAVDRALDQLAAQKGRDIVAPLGQPFAPRRRRVAPQRIIDVRLRNGRVGE